MPEGNQSESNQDGNTPGESTSTAGDEFTPITSQEELNKVIGERVKRVEAKFSDYKDLKAKASQLDEIEAANKTEAQRTQEALAAAQRDAEQARADALRFKVAAKFKLSDEDADLFLTGTDEATLTKQAERLAGIEQDRKRNGNRVSTEGSNPPAAADSERTAVRELFGT